MAYTEQEWQRLKEWWEYHVAMTIAAAKRRREAAESKERG